MRSAVLLWVFGLAITSDNMHSFSDTINHQFYNRESSCFLRFPRFAWLRVSTNSRTLALEIISSAAGNTGMTVACQVRRLPAVLGEDRHLRRKVQGIEKRLEEARCGKGEPRRAQP